MKGVISKSGKKSSLKLIISSICVVKYEVELFEHLGSNTRVN